MSWNYRVCKKVSSYKVDLSNDVYEEDQFGICGVYYNDEGEITFTSAEFQLPFGETLEELKADIEYMQKAFKLPVLDLDDIVYANY